MSGYRFPFTHYIERGDDDIELSVIYSVTPFIDATYWQPAEGGEVEIISVKHGGSEFNLTDAEEAALLTVCEERAGEDISDERAAASEWRDQQRRDDILMEHWENGQ